MDYFCTTYPGNSFREVQGAVHRSCVGRRINACAYAYSDRLNCFVRERLNLVFRWKVEGVESSWILFQDLKSRKKLKQAAAGLRHHMSLNHALSVIV